MEGTKATVTCHLDKVDGIIKAMSVVHVPDSYEKGSGYYSHLLNIRQLFHSSPAQGRQIARSSAQIETL